MGLRNFSATAAPNKLWQWNMQCAKKKQKKTQKSNKISKAKVLSKVNTGKHHFLFVCTKLVDRPRIMTGLFYLTEILTLQQPKCCN